MTLSIFGVRHHGTGCSRALVSALETFQPDMLLIEGPPEGTSALKVAGLNEAKAPVALIVYPESDPKRAGIYPFAEFSPEWVAIRYALGTGIPAEFIDLPVANRIGLEDAAAATSADGDAETDESNATVSVEIAIGEGDSVENADDGELRALAKSIREDPLATLARLAGEKDPERWEYRAIEQAATPGAVFPSFLEATTELRLTLRDAASPPEASPTDGETVSNVSASVDDDRDESDAESVDLKELKRLAAVVAQTSGGGGDELEPLREAAMRRAIREALKSGAKRVAVVCGAWHAPALDLETTDPRRKSLIPKKSEDDALLRKLPKTKTTATWIPWTHSRLERRTGYGAGIDAPAWLQEIWRASDESRRLDALFQENPEPFEPRDGRETYRDAASSFLARGARFLRDDQMCAAAANVVDSVRFAETLAALRERSAPGLDELREAAITVLCRGEETLYATIQRRLETGFDLGVVPSGVATPPLAKDIEKEGKRLRLKREEQSRNVDLDLRENSGRAKSRFFRRLAFIDVPWATPREDERNARGTFRETWTLAWRPEHEVAIVDASRYGATLEEAASNMAVARLGKTTTIAEIVELVERALHADLNKRAMEKIYRKLRDDVALSNDVFDAICAIPGLARTLRYGAVRGRADERLATIFDALFERATLRLREICVGINDEVAEEIAEKLAALVYAIALLEDAARLERLLDVFATVALDSAVSKYVAGFLARVLYERKKWSSDEFAGKLSFFVSPASPVEEISSWLQGFLRGSAGSILWFAELWRVVDGWLASLDRDVFVAQLPLLRRAFERFTYAERRTLAGTLANLRASNPTDEGPDERRPWDEPEFKRLLPVLNFILKGSALNAESRQGGTHD